jgi:hypothetical protein
MSLAGYPYNLDFDYGALAQLQHFSTNNLGDPFVEIPSHLIYDMPEM